jgi:mono/diheme cytochrome c family protein
MVRSVYLLYVWQWAGIAGFGHFEELMKVSVNRGCVGWPLVGLSLIAVMSIGILAGCDVERRKSDAELGLNEQQAAGRKVYDRHCDQCHEPYSSHGKKGPSLQGVFKKQYLPESGLPANDDRVGEIVRFGRSKMPAYGRELSDQQIQDLLAYLHTL